MAVATRPRSRSLRASSRLFIIGGMCFALASTPFLSSLANATALAVTYAVGAMFFTSAAYVQASRTEVAYRLGWWAATVQFVGTLFFNVDTLRALDQTVTSTVDPLVVWRPEVAGCVCFLVASSLAFGPAEAGGSRSPAWWNLVGSVLFGVSALAGYIAPGTTEPLNAAAMNATTMAGALCFVVAARITLVRTGA